ncbi:serine hydrolase domain-containing protein [Schlesneria sp. DSM 10557]|uniref:serine hydrolase domain-containing protein n=2 Tax=unclassified Schlesneria TaxID=2762017 RepID=UPI00359F17CB
MNELELAERLPATFGVFREGVDRQLHTGLQIYVSLQGEVLADGGFGLSAPGQPMTSETINLWLSAGKPLTVVAILQQWEQGRLRLDDPVVKFIPEFAGGGKDGITIRHILTHTCGFRNVETGWPEASWNDIIRRICDSSVEPDWVVGQTAGYHTASSWFILGEILSRLTGLSYPDAMRKGLFEPLGLRQSFTSLTPTQYAEYESRLGKIYTREGGGLQLLDWHEPARCEKPSPGANTRGPIRELGSFYEMLLNEGQYQGRQILTPQTVAAMTARHRVGEFDLTLAHKVDFGLGVIVNSIRYGAETVPYGYGPFCSLRTFGHGGAQSSQGWCDPERGLVVAYFFNGRPGEGQHGRRLRKLNEAICADLQLT